MYIPNNLLVNSFDELESTDNPSIIFDKFHALNSESDIKNFLFKNGIKVKNNFGAKEIFSYYTKKLSNEIFFPDAIFFSSKIRMIDLLRQRRYATYSSFNKKITHKKLRSWGLGFLSSSLIREVIHPFALVHEKCGLGSIVKKNCALIILPKSSPVCDRPWDESLIKKIISTSKEFSRQVILLIYYQDLNKFNSSSLSGLCDENINIASCGSRFDALFYYRLNYFMFKSNFIAYLEPGSHSIYAAYSNLKQLNFNAHIPTHITSGYQRSRYPKKSELELFNKIVTNYSEIKAPIEYQDLKIFLDNEHNFEDDIIGNIFHEIVYKMLRKIALKYDYFQRKYLK